MVGTPSALVNGRTFFLPAEAKDSSLLDWLRSESGPGLGEIRGECGVGACGTCTVLVDGIPTKSCVTPASLVSGKTVLTAEGLVSPNGKPHPLVQAFDDAGAIRCGLCIPGAVLSAYALLSRDPAPDRQAIRKALRGNVCRCLGTGPAIEAVELAVRRGGVS